MNKEKYGWLAGIIDGEGTITITKQNRQTWFSYRPEIHITNTNQLILKQSCKLLKEITGKTVKIFITDKKRKNYVYRVRLQDIESCKKLLIFLGPFLVGKKKQGKLLLEFLQNKKTKNGSIQAAKIHNLNLSSSC